MQSQEQHVVAERSVLANLKEAYRGAIDRYCFAKANSLPDIDEKILAVQRTGNAYYNHAEEFVGNSDLLGAHNNDMWVQGFAEDCFQILDTVPSHIEFLRGAFQGSNTLSRLSPEPAVTAYANMQRMVVRHLSKKVSVGLRNSFKKFNLPVYGFEHKAMSEMNKEKTLAFLFGTVFVCVLLVIAYLSPNPTSFQYGVYRTVLALAAAGVGAIVPGFLQVQYRSLVRAGGAIAVFVIVYFCVPAIA